ncbi:MAG: alpha/beta hydrolase-fold protein, partial [Chloroherpetonaceae bacterium]|nr:alpha/beta hydrolase-fold protein [Chloroherpetonaceae bacterium]
NANDRHVAITNFLDALQSANKIPFAIGDSVAFLYRGAATSVRWNGDFNSWGSVSGVQTNGTRLGDTDLWILEQTFPSDARLDYKIVLNGSTWILDPRNAFQQMSGFGPNSELRMPNYVFPPEVIRRPNVPQGSLSPNQIINSVHLGYAVQYRVYAPAGYDTLSNLPAIYVTDGHEYANDQMGSMVIVLDNLIYDGAIPPVMAVFIDPRNPYNLSQNRRMQELSINPQYLRFVKEELVPRIDSAYRTNPLPSARAILGTSLGGLNSAYFGVAAPETFGLIAIQSPAFWYRPQIFSMYQDSTRRPIRISMTVGTFFDGQNEARQMRDLLRSKAYQLYYREVPQGHSWGQWRGLIDEALIYFFGVPSAAPKPQGAKPARHKLLGNYPNPFNPTTTIAYELSTTSDVRLELFDVLGRKVATLVNERQSAGAHRLVFDASRLSLASGAYFCQLRANDFLETKKMLLLK